MIEVKVIELPGAIRTIALNDNSTISDALQTAGVSAEGKNLTVNNSPATLDTVLTNLSEVIVSKGAKGNA